jgi:hypothetical protein
MAPFLLIGFCKTRIRWACIDNAAKACLYSTGVSDTNACLGKKIAVLLECGKDNLNVHSAQSQLSCQKQPDKAKLRL